MIDESLDFLNLTEFRHRYLDELSGGQRQRTYVAMVLCQDTEYVMLDEPLNNLDMKHAVIMMKLLRKAADELGKPLSSSFMISISPLCIPTTFLAMRNGQLYYRMAHLKRS